MGGCVNDIPGTCVLKMIRGYRTLSWNLRHITMGGRVCLLARSWHLRLEDDAIGYRTLSWNLRHVTMGTRVGGCVYVPSTCVLKMMLRYRTLSWNLCHVTMGSGLGRCVYVPGGCIVKMTSHTFFRVEIEGGDHVVP